MARSSAAARPAVSRPHVRGDRFPLEQAAARVAPCGDEAKEAEVRKVSRLRRLGPHDALECGQTDPVGWLGEPTVGRLQRERVGGVSRHLAAAHRRDHLVLADRAKRRVRAKRDQRSERQQLERRRQVAGHQVLGPLETAPRSVGRPDEPVAAIPAHELGRSLVGGAAPGHLEHQAGEVAAAQRSQPVEHLAAADRGGHARDGRRQARYGRGVVRAARGVHDPILPEAEGVGTPLSGAAARPPGTSLRFPSHETGKSDA